MAKIAQKNSLWGPLMGWYSELGFKKVVEAETLAYYISPPNDFVYQFSAKSADLHFQVCLGLSGRSS